MGDRFKDQYETYARSKNNIDYANILKSNDYIPASKVLVPEIKKVIFNGPATIVYWIDGSKTVVKTQNEMYDREKGLAMAITKKALGNKGNYYNEIKKWVSGGLL